MGHVSRKYCIRSLVVLLAFYTSGAAWAQPSTNKEAQVAALEAERKVAVGQVEKIVNQPVLAYRRTPGMRVGEFKPGWLHEGASKPNFNAVDVRATQEKIYDNYEYVTSDLNPGIVFIGRQLEFNGSLKYFYTNRSLPKKKLTEAEMLEINRLYRIIGRCEHELVGFKNPQLAGSSGDGSAATAEAEGAQSVAATANRPRRLNIVFGAVLVLLILLILYTSFRGKRRRN